MIKHSFKVGDRVKVVHIMSTPLWENGPKLIGQIGIVSKVVDGRFSITVEFGKEKLENILGGAYGGNTAYYFNESEIEHAVKVGEQLTFQFMKG